MIIDARVIELLMQWEAARQAGRNITPDELCKDCPELLDEIRQRIADLALLTPMYLELPVEPIVLDPDKDLEPAGSLGRYRPVRFHKRGGIGEVYVAVDEELGRRVALKKLQAQQRDLQDSQRRFLQEAEITARLEHPGVVPVYGLVQDADGHPCYAMRFIEGESFKEAVRRFHDRESPKRDPGERSLALRQLIDAGGQNSFFVQGYTTWSIYWKWNIAGARGNSTDIRLGPNPRLWITPVYPSQPEVNVIWGARYLNAPFGTWVSVNNP
jgi:hypothetical protein